MDSKEYETYMKGLVFVELLSMADQQFGEDAVDSVLDTAKLPSGGAYTRVGYYPCEELVILVDAFSKISDIPSSELERIFGNWVLDAFSVAYPDMFVRYASPFDMLEAIEKEIHVEVRKLYPDAELPSITTLRKGNNLHLHYESDRPLANFCLGLIEGCFEKYKQKADITFIDQSGPLGGEANFHIDISDRV